MSLLALLPERFAQHTTQALFAARELHGPRVCQVFALTRNRRFQHTPREPTRGACAFDGKTRQRQKRPAAVVALFAHRGAQAKDLMDDAERRAIADAEAAELEALPAGADGESATTE